MAEPFDPAEFDASPSGDPHADYRTLLDAMRRAGAEGIAEEVGALTRQIEQEARQRADWGRTVGSEVRDLQRAAGALQQASTAMWWDRLKEWLYAALIGLGLIVRRRPRLPLGQGTRDRAAPVRLRRSLERQDPHLQGRMGAVAGPIGAVGSPYSAIQGLTPPTLLLPRQAPLRPLQALRS